MNTQLPSYHINALPALRMLPGDTHSPVPLCRFVSPDVSAIQPIAPALPASPAPAAETPAPRLVGAYDWKADGLDDDDENNPIPVSTRP